MTSVHRDPKLRASDADRDEVADLLREHVATGRLTMEEFGERLERTYAAQTYGDLDALIADLPGRDPYAGLPVPASTPNYADRPVVRRARRPAGAPPGRLARGMAALGLRLGHLLGNLAGRSDHRW